MSVRVKLPLAAVASMIILGAATSALIPQASASGLTLARVSTNSDKPVSGGSSGSYVIQFATGTDSADFTVIPEPPGWPDPRVGGTPLRFEDPVLSGPGDISPDVVVGEDPPIGSCTYGNSRLSKTFRVRLPANSESTLTWPFEVSALPWTGGFLQSKFSLLTGEGMRAMEVPSVTVGGSRTSWVSAWRTGFKSRRSAVPVSPKRTFSLTGRAWSNRSLRGKRVSLFALGLSFGSRSQSLGKAVLDKDGRFTVRKRIKTKGLYQVQSKLVGDSGSSGCGLVLDVR